MPAIRAFVLPPLMASILVQGAIAYPVSTTSDDIPDPGHGEFLTYFTYSGNNLKVLDGATFQANPTGSGYQVLDSWNSVEIGVLEDTSMQAIVPALAFRTFDGTSQASGLSDVTLAFSRRTWSNDRGSLRSRFRLECPTGNPDQEFGAGAWGIGTDQAVRQTFGDGEWTFTGLLNLVYRSRQVATNPETGLPVPVWRGLSGNLNLAIERPFGPVDLSLEWLTGFTTPGETNREQETQTGYVLGTISPGVTLNLGESDLIQFAALTTVLRTGWQDTFELGGILGYSHSW